MQDRTASLEAFLDATAAKTPAPGGGSVTALTGALAAAMGEMVLNYSVDRKDAVEQRPLLDETLVELHRARLLMLELMVEDQAAYEALTAARKLPAEQSDRQERIDAALLSCIRIPQSIGATALAVLDLCERVVDHVNPYLLSDLAVCADLAMATLRCAVYNVRINLNDVSDFDERSRFTAAVSELLSRGAIVIQGVSPRIWQRHARSG